MNSISHWAQCWQLPVASNKCSLMLFSRTMELVGGNNLCLDNKKLEPLRKTLDLGVTFEPDLKYKTHINLVCVKAKQKLNFMRKRILSNNPNLIIMIYKMYVLPVLMYCSPVWSPQTHDDILKLEKIQKKFTKSLSGYKNLSYKERLTKSNLKSLELSRLFADLIFCYKILHDLVDINNLIFLHLIQVTLEPDVMDLK